MLNPYWVVELLRIHLTTNLKGQRCTLMENKHCITFLLCINQGGWIFQSETYLNSKPVTLLEEKSTDIELIDSKST